MVGSETGRWGERDRLQEHEERRYRSDPTRVSTRLRRQRVITERPARTHRTPQPRDAQGLARVRQSNHCPVAVPGELPREDESGSRAVRGLSILTALSDC